MPKPKKGPRFGGGPSHHRLILSNLTTELIRHGRVRTTLAKARSAQPVAERMITFAKRGDLHGRRQVQRVVRDRDVVHKLFADVAPAFAERQGGYTRVLKLGPRKGDAAPMALLELVEGVTASGAGTLSEEPRRRWSLRRRRGGEQPAGAEPEAAAAAPATVAEPEAEEEAPEVDPAEVEARLAAEEETDEAADDEVGEEAEAATGDEDGEDGDGEDAR